MNDDSFFVIDDVRHVIEEALSDNQLAKRYKLFSFNVSDRKNENRNERTQNIKLAEYGSKISKRYHIIRNRDGNCPYCNTKLTELTTYCRFRCYKCINCNAILMRSDMYYLLDPVDRVVFDNENELPEISFDNSRYAIQLEKERIVLYREQRERAKERRKQKEETRELKQALKIAEERGGEPLGKLPKQVKRGFFS